MTDSEEHIIDSENQGLFNWGELWRYRELFYFFAWRDIKIKYKQTVLGFLWAILQPLLMMIIFTVFFWTRAKCAVTKPTLSYFCFFRTFIVEHVFNWID